MKNLFYDNGFISVKVDVYDDEVAYHVSNYMNEDGKKDIEPTYLIKAFLEEGFFDEEKKIIETKKGEYEENIVVFEHNGERCYYNKDNDTTYYWENESVLIIMNGDKKGLFIDTYRAIRQILIHDLLNRGGIVIHSSSIHIGDKGYLFVGNKRAGKTSSLFQYLNDERKDVYYGSNERTILLEKDRKIFMYGWPGTAFVGVGTIMSTIGLEALIDVHNRAGETAKWLSLHQLISDEYVKELIQMGEEAYDVQNKVWLTSKEIAYLTKKNIKNYGYLDKVIWPNLSIGQKQVLKSVKKTLENDEIKDLKFFGDWLEISNRKENNKKETIHNMILNLSQYEIIGHNLVTRIDDLS